MSNTRVRIPADLSGEDAFIFKMSPRQLALVLGSLFLWFGVAKYLVASMFGLAMWAALIGTLWVPAAGIALALIKPDGRTLDTVIGEKIAFHFSARVYEAREQDHVDERELIAQHADRPRVIR